VGNVDKAAIKELEGEQAFITPLFLFMLSRRSTMSIPPHLNISRAFS
jgi:hypothetical protein